MHCDWWFDKTVFFYVTGVMLLYSYACTLVKVYFMLRGYQIFSDCFEVCLLMRIGTLLTKKKRRYI